ncbi:MULTISPECIES: hypothetical protein [unclassified Streptomyces]|uniref:hypothetical protein n=1 Tax=unclassified Streptomyces TaxID=2593676 RepID=UPI00093887A0|nr:hypothetical protein [Streptomyces sp. CB02058]OKI92207.1 hypothetical protein AMK10_20715 [Streptomyces sp. CB02058]
MALHARVTELLAEACILDVDVDDAVTDEHVRASACRRVVLATAASADRDRDRAIVATTLRDPMEMVSKTAAVALVDSIAMKVSGPADFRQWSAQLLPESDRLRADGHRDLIHRRIHDWLFCLSVKGGHVPTPIQLVRVTDWIRRVLAQEAASSAALTLLVEPGNTRKIRNITRNRAGRLGLRTR